jgi:hypothetical protein
MQVEKEKKEILLGKQDKIRYSVYMKCKVKFNNFVDDSNWHSCIVFVMREINKSGVKYGFTKKTLAVEILTLLLSDIGCPELLARASAEVVAEVIEAIYLQGYHKKSSCDIL